MAASHTSDHDAAADRHPDYDAGRLLAPAEELTDRTLSDPTQADGSAAGLLMAMLGWDRAMTELAGSSHPRAGAVMGAVAGWLLFD